MKNKNNNKFNLNPYPSSKKFIIYGLVALFNFAWMLIFAISHVWWAFIITTVVFVVYVIKLAPFVLFWDDANNEFIENQRLKEELRLERMKRPLCTSLQNLIVADFTRQLHEHLNEDDKWCYEKADIFGEILCGRVHLEINGKNAVAILNKLEWQELAYLPAKLPEKDEQVDTENLDEYSCTAIFMALNYSARTDAEFENCFTSILSAYDTSTGFTICENEMGILCDNLYRRLKKQDESYSILTNGTVQPLTRTHITAGRFVPLEQIGDVSILQDNFNGENTSTTTSAPTDNSDFVGKYKNTNRILTAEEQALVPEVKSHLVIPKFVKTVCKHIRLSFDKPIKMGNVMFRGIAGTGKTTAAKLVAAGLGLPYGNVTCSADTQIFDLLAEQYDLPYTKDGYISSEDVYNDISRIVKEKYCK